MATKPELKELGDFLDPVLQIPYRGKNYQIEQVSAETGLRFQKLLAVGIKTAQGQEIDPQSIELVSNAEEKGFFEEVLGGTYAELIADGVSANALKVIGSTTFMWVTQGFDAAKSFWDNGGKAQAPNRAARRTATQTRTGAGTTTKPQASRTTTSTQKAKPQAKATNGRTSSSTGTASKRTSKSKE